MKDILKLITIGNLCSILELVKHKKWSSVRALLRQYFNIIVRPITSRYYPYKERRYEAKLEKALKSNKAITIEYYTSDCDMAESYGVKVFANKKEYDKYRDNLGIWEGSYSENFITYEQYLSDPNAHYSFDRILSAYENGNGKSILV